MNNLHKNKICLQLVHSCVCPAKKQKKFDKKIQVFQGLQGFFFYLTVKLP